MDDEFGVSEPAEKPIGYPPKNAFVKQALEKMYISIMGALDLGDFDTFLRESQDLTYDEAKDKMIREFGTQKDLSEARLKAKDQEAALKIQIAEQEALAEQRTLEQEFAELDEVARSRLGENLELSRRNEELQREVKRLKEELGRARTPLPGVPSPTVPITPAAPAVHGSMYNEYKRLISQVVTIAEVNDIANELFDIMERGEFNKLTKQDLAEMRDELSKIASSRAIKLAEMKLPGAKPIINKVPVAEEEKELPRRKRREAVPAFPIPSGIPQISYKYNTPDVENFFSMGDEFIRDFELERTIKINRLLLFPDYWYTLSPWAKKEVYGWDMATAMREAVDHLHKFSWNSLNSDYGIPKGYIEAWRTVK